MERRTYTHKDQIEGDLDSLANQVSTMISDYNHSYPFEMLPKTPQMIVEQLSKGLSVMVTTTSEQNPVALFHATMYPNFEQGEENRLGCQVVECGGWVANDRYRKQGLGTYGVGKLLELGKELWEPALFIATHKREAALKVSQHLGLTVADYREHPYLAYLTCTCTNCSEAHGFSSCGYRRTTPDVEVVGEGGKIACTLVVSDLALAAQFEDRCRDLHSQTEGPLEPGTISMSSMVKARRFFEWLKTN